MSDPEVITNRLFHEWLEANELSDLKMKGKAWHIAELAFAAGYAQRSSEVAEELRLFRGLMDGIRLDPDE